MQTNYELDFVNKLQKEKHFNPEKLKENIEKMRDQLQKQIIETIQTTINDQKFK